MHHLRAGLWQRSLREMGVRGGLNLLNCFFFLFSPLFSCLGFFKGTAVLCVCRRLLYQKKKVLICQCHKETLLISELICSLTHNFNGKEPSGGAWMTVQKNQAFCVFTEEGQYYRTYLNKRDHCISPKITSLSLEIRAIQRCVSTTYHCSTEKTNRRFCSCRSWGIFLHLAKVSESLRDTYWVWYFTTYSKG